MFSLNFTRKVLGPEASLKLERHEVTQTIRAGTNDIIKAIKNGELRAGDELGIALDGENVGFAYLAGCQLVAAVDLASEDAERGGFDSLEKLGAVLKRAGYRFKPLMDYTFYRVQFGWR